MARLGREHLADMGDEGARIKARRERLGYDKKALAAEAGVNRNTLAAIEAGESFNRSSLAKIERKLDELEEEAGINAPPSEASTEASGQQLMEIEVEGDRIIVRGPVSDPDRLAHMAAQLIRQMRENNRRGEE